MNLITKTIGQSDTFSTTVIYYDRIVRQKHF